VTCSGVTFIPNFVKSLTLSSLQSRKQIMQTWRWSVSLPLYRNKGKYAEIVSKRTHKDRTTSGSGCAAGPTGEAELFVFRNVFLTSFTSLVVVLCSWSVHRSFIARHPGFSLSSAGFRNRYKSSIKLQFLVISCS
jgi:hypothetical protein